MEEQQTMLVEISEMVLLREEAVRLVNKYDDEFQKIFSRFLDYIKISENEYWETIDHKTIKLMETR